MGATELDDAEVLEMTPETAHGMDHHVNVMRRLGNNMRPDGGGIYRTDLLHALGIPEHRWEEEFARICQMWGNDEWNYYLGGWENLYRCSFLGGMAE